MTLQDSIRYFTEETHIMPCLSVACGDAGRFVCERGGMQDENGTPLTERSLFDLASLTKLFTGLAVNYRSAFADQNRFRSPNHASIYRRQHRWSPWRSW